MNKRELPESKVPGQELFSFGGRYLVAPEATSGLLLDDAGCWTTAASEIVNVLAIELDDDGSDLAANPRSASRMLWGVFHLLEMVQGAITTAQLRLEDKA